MIKKILVNNQIRAYQVRLVDEKEKQLGVMPTEEALKLASERNLDLIQVTEKVEPPVCKLGDYGKYLYREEKKSKLSKKQKRGELKGIRLTFNISLHDLETKVHQAEKFLNKGDRIRIELRLRGREKAHQEIAKAKIGKFIEMLIAVVPIKIERELKKEPRGLTMIISKQ